ncbi:hypothetical protein [Zymomonas mobilis]|uniref:hypothetical protein n=1 Tax=Zymomonas mobilis TaxID=542 RepID=UPI0039ED95B5
MSTEPNQSTNYQYTIEQVKAGAVEAKWHSKKGARYHVVKFGEGTAVRHLSHCLGSADAAMQAAKAEFNNRNRGSLLILPLADQIYSLASQSKQRASKVALMKKIKMENTV